MPGFLRSCYVGIGRYLSHKETNKEKKTNKIEVQETELDQTNSKNEQAQHVEDEKLCVKDYLNLKLQLIHKLEQHATIDDQKCIRNSDMREIFFQEIKLINQLLGK